MKRFLLLALLPALLGAPAPRPRPAPQRQLVGWHVLVWGTGRYDCLLSRDGFYGCRAAGWSGTWEGRWSWCQRTRTLSVTEHAQGQHLESRQWKAKLDSTLAGYGGYVDPTTGEVGEITICLEAQK